MNLSIALSRVSDTGEDLGNDVEHLLLDSHHTRLLLDALKSDRASAQTYDLYALDTISDAIEKAGV